MDTIDVVRLVKMAIFNRTSLASYRPWNFLSVTRMSKTKVLVNDMGGAHLQSIWKICITPDVKWIYAQLDKLDDEVIEEFAHYRQVSKENLREEILKVIQLRATLISYLCWCVCVQWGYDETTATYFLLLQQKLRGRKPTILLPPQYVPVDA